MNYEKFFNYKKDRNEYDVPDVGNMFYINIE